MLTLQEFEKKYFYKTDLIKLCRRYGLPTYGTKAELNQYIIDFLSGKSTNDIEVSRVKKSKKVDSKITLATKIVGENFAFNDEARALFANYLGVKKFSFKKEMAIIKRTAEKENNTEMTVLDLIKEYQNKKGTLSSNEESTYQWNHFVKDFCASPKSALYKEKLKTAAILWGKVKNSSQPKQFTEALVEKYADEIKKYKISR